MEMLAVFLKPGLTSFSGPVAHTGYFRRELVERRRWLDDAVFTDLAGLCQFLPGSASNQIGFSVGLLRVGWRSRLAVWYDFTLPSVLLLLAFAMFAPNFGGSFGVSLIHGLGLIAVAVVVQVAWDMARKLRSDRQRAGTAVLSIAVLGVLTTVYVQFIAIAPGVTLSLVLCRTPPLAGGSQRAGQEVAFSVPHAASIASLALLCALLFGLPVLTDLHPWMSAKVFDAFYCSGVLVFGGGYVVLPLLEQQTVATGRVVSNDLLVGYGVAQAVPGPFFTFVAFLGWTIGPGLNYWVEAALTMVGISLPG